MFKLSKIAGLLQLLEMNTGSFKLSEWCAFKLSYLIPNISKYSTVSTSWKLKNSTFCPLLCFAFTRSVPFSNVLIFCWFFMRIKDIGSLSTQTSFTTKLRGVFRTQSNIYDGVFCGNSWRVSVLLRCLTGFWDASLKLSGSCCLLKPNYWNFNSNIL